MLNPLLRDASPATLNLESSCGQSCSTVGPYLSNAQYREAIRASGLSIYDHIEPTDPVLWLPAKTIEGLLSERLSGVYIGDLANRTKSKFVKSAACEALGYPIPSKFERVKPRFQGQMLDIHLQKGTNLQMYNSEATACHHRYALVEQQQDGLIGRVRVVDRADLLHGATGTVTNKFQAMLATGSTVAPLFGARRDTEALAEHVLEDVSLTAWHSPTLEPASGELLSLDTLERRLSPLVGTAFDDPGIDQERKRGEAVHRLVCEKLGYLVFGDTGTFPDIKHQLLEIKLQTSRTIDLGGTLPDSEGPLDLPRLGAHKLRYCDTRYAVFFADTDGQTVTITQLIVTNGRDFFTVFRKCGGRGANQKTQLSLGKSFFEKASRAPLASGVASPSGHKRATFHAPTTTQLSLW